MKKRFDMTEADLRRILDASKPTIYMVFGNQPPLSSQDNANAAWRELGDRMGFDGMSAEPIPGAPPTAFLATPKPITAPLHDWDADAIVARNT